jgi:PAS domain S-box-containing protein
MLDSLPDAVIAIDARGTILSWNRAAERIFLIARESAVGRDLLDTLEPASSANTERAHWQNALAARTPTFDTQAQRADGSPVYAECTLSAPEPGSGETARMLCIRDMTQKEYQRQSAAVARRP